MCWQYELSSYVLVQLLPQPQSCDQPHPLNNETEEISQSPYCTLIAECMCDEPLVCKLSRFRLASIRTIVRQDPGLDFETDES